MRIFAPVLLQIHYQLLETYVVCDALYRADIKHICEPGVADIELANCIPLERYMAILSEEDEQALLLEQISKKPSCIFTYGKKLAKHYPSEVFSLCANAIHRRTETANTRVIYRQVCSDIKKLASYGGRDEAHAIIQELREKTQRRPAFLEELQYISAKI